MRVRLGSSQKSAWEGEATIQSNHKLSSYKSPLVFINGEPLGPMEATFEGYEIIEATEKEKELLLKGGYVF